MASTSVSCFKYDVFLSFRGEDTRKNFVDHLYLALTQKGIETYKDDENIKQGKMISDELIKAIEDSKFYIIVFSKNYASSSWCLEELVKIMECRKGFGHTAYPVFYDVEPTEVRNQSGAVGDAFAKHGKGEAARKWRDALKEASDLAGWELKSIANGHEAKFIQKIVQEISLELRFINSSIDGNLIGMKTRVNEVISSLEPGAGDVRMLGIWGMGGAGKTTLARAIFDQISTQFEGQSFIENVREVSKASLVGLKKLQKQALSDVLRDQNIKVSSVSGGKIMIQKMMRGRKVLLVLDDVDHKDQLEALAGDCNWFKPGSRIIITTRDKQVLVAHRVSLIHNVTLLSQAQAGRLFSRYAFGRENPIQGYEELSGKVLRYADGLPLTIKVMGSFLCGQSEPYWIDAIERLKAIPLTTTMDRLEISFDGLEKEYKEIFLDVACILKGWNKEAAIIALESRGFHAKIGLRVLEQKSLITCTKNGQLGMHDHLEEMGRNIVRRLYPDEPNKHSRLWINEEIKDILTTGSGTQATQCLIFRSLDFIAETEMKGLANMKDLRVIVISISAKCNSINWKFDQISQYFPSSLQFVKWHGFPFSSLPNTFQGENLVGLEMGDNNIVQLWEDGEGKVLYKLRFLTIINAKLRTLDLTMVPNLEVLNLEYCNSLVELHMPTKCLKLKSLCLVSSKLKILNLGMTPNLETLSLKDCDDLVELHLPTTCLKLRSLCLISSKLKILNLGVSPNLHTLILKDCQNLAELRMPSECLKLIVLKIQDTKLRILHLGVTPNLETLILKDCHDLAELRMPSECLKLILLIIKDTKLRILRLGVTPNLETLILEDCHDLVELHMPSECLKLKVLEIWSSKLRNLYIGITPKLREVSLNYCNDLVELHMPAESLKLTSLDVSHSKLRSIQLGITPNLKILFLEGCKDLVELYIPTECLNLICLNLSHSKLRTLCLGNTLNLERLILEGCDELVELHMPAQSLKLRCLDLRHSKLRILDLGLTPNLRRLYLENCYNLVEINAQVGYLKKLVYSEESGCGRPESFLYEKEFDSNEVGSLCKLLRIQEPMDACLLHSDNKYPQFKFSCTYKDPVSSFGNVCINYECFSESICRLQYLRTLTLIGNVPEAPNDLGMLEYLEDLTLFSVELKHLPDSICMLKHLKSLEIIFCCHLEKVTEDIGRLECLNKLIIMECEVLQNIPDSICKMKRLEYLRLPKCIRIEKLPAELGHLQCLKVLDIEGTSISRLPLSIFRVKGLHIVGSRQLLRFYIILLNIIMKMRSSKGRKEPFFRTLF